MWLRQICGWFESAAARAPRSWKNAVRLTPLPPWSSGSRSTPNPASASHLTSSYGRERSFSWDSDRSRTRSRMGRNSVMSSSAWSCNVMGFPFSCRDPLGQLSILGLRQVGAASISRPAMPAGQTVALTEYPVAQGLALDIGRAEAATLPQDRHHQLDEVPDRVKGVVLAQVDAVDADLVQPAFDLVSHDLRRAGHKERTRCEITERG